MTSTIRAEKAYEFLQLRSRDQQSFTYVEVAKINGWKENTVKAYCSKHWKDFLSRVSAGCFRVKPDFQRTNLTDFLSLSTQKKTIYSRYQRDRYEVVVTYEFLLPLTREDQLRKALDELFYLDTIQRRLQEIGLKKIQEWVSRIESETDSQYLEKAARDIGDRFGGYSISHINGRFRAAELRTRTEAAKLLEDNYPYLTDETTASVRFIFPVKTSKAELGDGFGRIDSKRVGPVS